MQEEYTICFYENPNVLKLVFDRSSNGHKGPLIQLVTKSKKVDSVISRPAKLKHRPLIWFSFHNWLKNTKVVCYKKPQHVYNEHSSYDTHLVDSHERIFNKYRVFEHDVNFRKEVHTYLYGGKKYGTHLPTMPYQRFMKNQAFC
jgi:hypothetical protein